MKKLPKGLKILLIVVLSILALIIVVCVAAPEPSEKASTETTETTVQTEATEAVPHRKEAVGVSDLDCEVYLDGEKPSSVLEDVTESWQLFRVATTDGNFEKYAKSFAEKYLSEEKSVAYIVNFTNKVTICVRLQSGLIFVDSTEYVSKEEHSAKTLGGGIPLSSYIVYTDNGDIEKVG